MSEIFNNLSSRCDEAVAKHNLLDHPFYRRWTNGTLPVAALRDYAREYGTFIRKIGRGWETIGRADIARIEDAHARVWEMTFAAGLRTSVADDPCPVLSALLTISTESFGDRASAIGALYAIEAQQPVVAKEKIRGLQEHYADLPEKCAEYFRLHTDDYNELKILKKEMDRLTPEEQETALAACDRMATALFDALTSIEAPYAKAAARWCWAHV